MTINASTYAFLTTADAVRDFAAALTEETKAALLKKTAKMPKAKALELINATFPGYEATDVYTVRDNITAAWDATIIALTDRLEELEAPAEVAEESTEKEVEALLTELSVATAAKDKNAAKRIRAALRRRGWFQSKMAAE
jgi:hypothetical protein